MGSSCCICTWLLGKGRSFPITNICQNQYGNLKKKVLATLWFGHDAYLGIQNKHSWLKMLSVPRTNAKKTMFKRPDGIRLLLNCFYEIASKIFDKCSDGIKWAEWKCWRNQYGCDKISSSNKIHLIYNIIMGNYVWKMADFGHFLHKLCRFKHFELKSIMYRMYRLDRNIIEYFARYQS